jgi:hypothetical protein
MKTKKKRKLTILHYPNYGNSGVDWDIVYHPALDGPLKNYKNRNDVKIRHIYLEV